MSGFPRLQLHTGDYLKDTPPMCRANWEHHGIYLIALMLTWNTPKCQLPNDPQWLAERFGCTEEELERHVRPVLLRYFKSSGNFLRQKRLTEEHKFVKTQSARAKSRWQKEKASCRNAVAADAPTPTPTPTPTKEEESKKERSGASRPAGDSVSISGNGVVFVREPHPIELPVDGRHPKPKRKYAFEGEVLHLTDDDYRKWELAYPEIDLRAELTARDDWLAVQTADIQERWFPSTSSWLKNLNNKIKAEKRKEKEIEDAIYRGVL